MSWLTNFVRPTLKRLIAPRVLRETQWITCPNCGATIFHKDLDTNWRICPHCEHHLTLAAARRFALLLDQDNWSRIEAPATTTDPLKFRDSKRYSDRLREAEEFSQESEAIVVAHGKLDNIRVVIAACEPHFLSGTLGSAAGEALIAAAELAILQDAPLIFVTGSHGPRLQEGAFALMQLPRVHLAFRKVTEANLPVITVLADPVFDPTSDILAQQSDIVLAEPGARIGPPPADPMAPMDMPDSLKDRDGVLSTSLAMEQGRIDRVVDRRNLKSEISAILTLLQSPFPIAQVLTYPGPTPDNTTDGNTLELGDGDQNG